MLIEIHMIQNHSPSNLNRDDQGAPKTCLFGGVPRARISSQCLKRSIRRSPAFQAVLEREGGVRTRRLITILAEEVHGGSDPPEELVVLIAKAFEKGGVKRVKRQTAQEPDNTNILLFVPRSSIPRMADAVAAESGKKKPNHEALAQAITDILGESASVPDIALSGRMTELDREGLFAKLNLHVDASLSAAHAISTHRVVNETDYFTAVDDRGKPGGGAAHPDEAMFNSACFYKYFSLDWDQLVHNLAGSEPDPEGDAHKKWQEELKPEAERLAAATLGHFLRAAAVTTPTGKQKSSAAYNRPDGILVEVKKNRKPPMSYANAFAEPARRIGDPPDDAPDALSLVGRSIAQLGDHVYSLRRAFEIGSTLLWYSPELWRYPLQGWEREADGQKKKVKGKDKAVPIADQTFDALGGEGKAAGLVEAVLREVGFRWSKVKDAGRGEAEVS